MYGLGDTAASISESVALAGIGRVGSDATGQRTLMRRDPSRLTPSNTYNPYAPGTRYRKPVTLSPSTSRIARGGMTVSIGNPNGSADAATLRVTTCPHNHAVMRSSPRDVTSTRTALSPATRPSHRSATATTRSASEDGMSGADENAASSCSARGARSRQAVNAAQQVIATIQ